MYFVMMLVVIQFVITRLLMYFDDDGCGDLVCNNKTINVFDDDGCGGLVCN